MRRRNRTSKISVRMVAGPGGPGSSYGYANESTADSRAAAAVVQQEMNNVQKLKRLSLGATSTLDPDLPSQFAWYDESNTPSRSPSSPSSLSSSSSSSDAPPPAVPPKSPTHASSSSSSSPTTSSDGTALPSHAAELLWVPANVHPELAPQEWKSFVQHKVDEIRQKTVPQSSRSSLSNESTSEEGDNVTSSGSSPSRSPSASSASSLSRRNSLLSRQVRTQSEFRDGSDIIEERRTSQENNPQSLSRLSAQLRELGELESLAMDPFQLARSLSYGDLSARNNTPSGSPSLGG